MRYSSIPIKMLICATATSILLPGCTKQGYSVLASTGTSIGVEISQNPATQFPQGKLGYNRAELAFVPTNRNGGSDAGGAGNGAKDSANVLMELRYGGIFDWGATSGIYQRLAVGTEAVTQPGAAFMFAKNAEGDLSAETSQAVAQALSPEALAAERRYAAKAIAHSIIVNGGIDQTKLKEFFVKCAGKDETTATNLTRIYAKLLSEEDFAKALLKDFGPVAEDWRKQCNYH